MPLFNPFLLYPLLLPPQSTTDLLSATTNSLASLEFYVNETIKYAVSLTIFCPCTYCLRGLSVLLQILVVLPFILSSVFLNDNISNHIDAHLYYLQLLAVKPAMHIQVQIFYGNALLFFLSNLGVQWLFRTVGVRLPF